MTLTEQGKKCEEAIGTLKLVMGNVQHIYIAELVGKLKKRRHEYDLVEAKKKNSPALLRDIAALETNIIYQIEHPIHDSTTDAQDDSGKVRGDAY